MSHSVHATCGRVQAQAGLCYPITVMDADWVTAWGTVVTAAASVVLAVGGVYGLRTWRTQLRGGAHFDRAHRVLAAVYKVRDTLKQMRHSLWWEDAATVLAAGKANPHLVGLSERWNRVADAATELDVEIRVAEALWGTRLAEPAAALRVCIAELFASAKVYTVMVGQGMPTANDATFASAKRVLGVASDGEPDAFAAKVQAAVDDFDKQLLP